MHEQARIILGAPASAIRSTDVSLWVSPSQLGAGTSFPRRGRPFALSAVRKAAGFEALRATVCVCALQAW